MFSHEVVTAEHHQFQFLANGIEAFAALERLVGSAQRSLSLEMYIFKADDTGVRIRTALIDARRRGVRVRLLLDAFGSGQLPRDFFGEFLVAGGELRWFNPSRVLRMAFRNHRKLCVADQTSAIVGGFNIGDEYAGDGVQQGWRDIGIQITGPLAGDLSNSFDRMFIAGRMTTASFLSLAKGRVRKPITLDQPELLTAGPGFGGASMRRILYKDVLAATQVAIAAAYFAPTWLLQRRLLNAARRGSVRLVLPGKSDVAVLLLAGRHLYMRMLRAGVHIFEYQPQIMHSKLLILDDVVYIGSCNLDTRSLRINFELLVRLPVPALAAQAQKIIDTDITNSLPVTLVQWQAADKTWRRVLQQIAFWAVVRLDPFLARRRLRAFR